RAATQFGTHRLATAFDLAECGLGGGVAVWGVRTARGNRYAGLYLVDDLLGARLGAPRRLVLLLALGGGFAVGVADHGLYFMAGFVVT
ncbi:hypothetical protein AAGG49_21925, partial [Stenotrophomonas maltophilia]|uniref:hypothetical protein n=1 Tax=Stenotrophomonas maltophilia TaxID=40324 RepID=UPI00313AFD0D